MRTLKSRRRRREGEKEEEERSENEREKNEGAGKRIGRKGEAPRWSYDGNGVRHLTEDGKGWIVRKVGGEAG